MIDISGIAQEYLDLTYHAYTTELVLHSAWILSYNQVQELQIPFDNAHMSQNHKVSEA